MSLAEAMTLLQVIRRRAAASASPLFFRDLLKHLLIEHQFDDDGLEAIDLGLEFANLPSLVDLILVKLLSPAVISVLDDAEFSANIGDRQALGQVAFGFAQ